MTGSFIFDFLLGLLMLGGALFFGGIGCLFVAFALDIYKDFFEEREKRRQKEKS